MNSIDKKPDNKDEEVLKALFKHASSRQRAPQAVENEIREALHGEWKQQTRQRRVRRRVAGWAIAASVILAIFVSTGLLRQPAPDLQQPSLATVEKMTGEVHVRNEGEQDSRLLTSVDLVAGSVLSTGNGARISLTWENGESIRVDENSRIALISSSGIGLLSGHVYIDSSGARGKGKAFSIRTPSGPVSHIGTQYITGIAGDGITLSVREGEVFIGSGTNRTIARQGQKLSVSGDGRQSVTSIPVYGESWQWIEQLAPDFDMDGRTMQDFLEWVGHETGLEIEYDSDETRLAAVQTRMHGMVNLEPLRAMDLIMQTSDLTHVLKDGTILVSNEGY